MTAAPNLYAKARSETAELLNFHLACPTPDQSLRLDCAVALRLALDDLQGRVVRGESIDVSRTRGQEGPRSHRTSLYSITSWAIPNAEWHRAVRRCEVPEPGNLPQDGGRCAHSRLVRSGCIAQRAD